MMLAIAPITLLQALLQTPSRRYDGGAGEAGGGWGRGILMRFRPLDRSISGGGRMFGPPLERFLPIIFSVLASAHRCWTRALCNMKTRYAPNLHPRTPDCSRYTSEWTAEHRVRSNERTTRYNIRDNIYILSIRSIYISVLQIYRCSIVEGQPACCVLCAVCGYGVQQQVGGGGRGRGRGRGMRNNKMFPRFRNGASKIHPLEGVKLCHALPLQRYCNHSNRGHVHCIPGIRV